MPTSLDRSSCGPRLGLIIGSLVGIERERSKALSGNVGIGGVRTFILFALMGGGRPGCRRRSANAGSSWPPGAVAALTVAGSVVQARVKPNAVGLTTETAAIGCACWAAAPPATPRWRSRSGSRCPRPRYKEPMHGLVAKLGSTTSSAGSSSSPRRSSSSALLPRRPRPLGRAQAAVDLDPRDPHRPPSPSSATSRRAPSAAAVHGVTGLSGASSPRPRSPSPSPSRAGGGREDRRRPRRGAALAWSVMGVRIVVWPRSSSRPSSAAAAALRGDDRGHPRGGRPLSPPRRPRAARRRVALKNLSALAIIVRPHVAAVLVVVAAASATSGARAIRVAALAGLTTWTDHLSMTGLARSGAAPSPPCGGPLVAALANTLVKLRRVVATASGRLRRSIVVVTAGPRSRSAWPRSCWPESRLSPPGSRRGRSGPSLCLSLTGTSRRLSARPVPQHEVVEWPSEVAHSTT